MNNKIQEIREAYGKHKVIMDLLSEYDRMKEALEWYADKRNYEENVTDQWGPFIPVERDDGQKAREALSHIERITPIRP